SHATQATFDSSTNYTFPKQVSDAMSQTVTFSWANNTTLTSAQDPNTNQVNFGYDSYTRPTTVTRPDGGTTTYIYDDVGDPNNGNLVNMTQQDLIDNTVTPNVYLMRKTYYDGFGRVVQQGTQRDASTWEWVKYVYDSCSCSSIGKQAQVSNPYK